MHMKNDIENSDVMICENNWYKYCHKNILLEKLYGEFIPALIRIEIVKVDFELRSDKQYSSNIQLVVRLKSMPANMPVKWHRANVNCIEMKLDILNVESICIKEDTSTGSDIIVYQNANNVVVRLQGGLSGEIKCLVNHNKVVENVLVSADKCLAISEIKGIHEN